MMSAKISGFFTPCFIRCTTFKKPAYYLFFCPALLRADVIYGCSLRLMLNRVELDEADTFEADDEMQNLRVMDLAVRPSYIFACYASLAERYDWEEPVTCECSVRRGNYRSGIQCCRNEA